MAVFKCKMCGGALEVNNETIAVCEYCGTKQTLPKLEDDRRAQMYDRANHFRRNNEFDKAMGIYEQILNEDNTDAEAYWSLVLCRYGIEYVEDPSSRKRIPTVNRAQFTSIFDDEDYKSALQYADGYQKDIYEQEATTINEIQKGILAISQKEEPFDVFICYKETDNNGRRTPDSVLATELYHELTRDGFKVFFARITLEDKLGSAYEPYIFAALNSAKVMVALGTKPEHFNAVWVKNEWSRYLALIKNGARKMLIPAYKDMDPYDLPEEFSHLQAQDMSKLGFMQDLIRGIKKIVEVDAPKQTIRETVVTNDAVGGNVSALLKRGFMALEDEDWSKADEFFEQALNQNAELAEAYLGKLMIDLQVKSQENLKNCDEPFENLSCYQKVLRFADNELKSYIIAANDYIKEQNNKKALEENYNRAVELMSLNKKDSYAEAKSCFENLSGYLDSDTLATECEKEIERICLEEEQKAEKNLIKRKKAKKIIKISTAISAPIVALTITVVLVFNAIIIPNSKYNTALDHIKNEEYEQAKKIFKELDDFKDSKEKVEFCTSEIESAPKKQTYKNALNYLEGGFYKEALSLFNKILDYKDAKSKSQEAQYALAEECMKDEDYYGAYKNYKTLSTVSYKDSINKKDEAAYNYATVMLNQGSYSTAMDFFELIPNYNDSSERLKEATLKYVEIVSKLDGYVHSDYGKAVELARKLGNYGNAKKILSQLLDRIKTKMGNGSDTSGYTYCTVSDLHNNPQKYNGKKVFVFSNIGTVEGWEPAGADPYTDVLISDDISVNISSMSFYDYYSAYIKPDSRSYIGIRLSISETNVNSIFISHSDRLAVCGKFTYNPQYKEGGYITDPHPYHIEADYFESFILS